MAFSPSPTIQQSSQVTFLLPSSYYTHFKQRRLERRTKCTLKGSKISYPKMCHLGMWIVSVQFNSVAQSCPTLCDPMNRSTPGLPVHHQLLEFTQTHVHRVSDVIQPSHLLSSPSPPAPNPS